MKFTKEEVSLCKQIAEKHKKKLKHGDWFYDEKSKTAEIFHRNKIRVERKILTYIHPTGELPDVRCFHWFPLWTISDCLEFLEEEERLIELRNSPTPKYGKYYIACYMSGEHPNRQHGIYKYGKTPLEACLKAVLAVLEEGK